jgi:hypothetical protein
MGTIKPNAIAVRDKLSQQSILELLNSTNWEQGSKFPYVVEFDPTTKCNLACPDCISGSLLDQDEFENVRVRELVGELIEGGVKAVILIGGGEPMMHPETDWIIRTFGSHGVHLGITTNGLYLKKHLDALSEFANWVRVSVDAGTSETFNRVRPSKAGTSMFPRVLDNIADYAKVKKKGNKLGFSFMVFAAGDYGFKGIPISSVNGKERFNSLKNKISTNVHEIALAAEIAKNIGCDYFEIKPMYDVNHFSVIQHEKIADIVEEQLDIASTLNDDRFQIIEALKLRASLRGGNNIEPKYYTRCAISELRTLVTPSGVYVCPYFRGVESKNIGDPTKHSFAKIWSGERRKEVMGKLDPSIDCSMHCIRNDSNIFIEKYLSDADFRDSTHPSRDYDRFI